MMKFVAISAILALLASNVQAQQSLVEVDTPVVLDGTGSYGTRPKVHDRKRFHVRPHIEHVNFELDHPLHDHREEHKEHELTPAERANRVIIHEGRNGVVYAPRDAHEIHRRAHRRIAAHRREHGNGRRREYGGHSRSNRAARARREYGGHAAANRRRREFGGHSATNRGKTQAAAKSQLYELHHNHAREHHHRQQAAHVKTNQDLHTRRQARRAARKARRAAAKAKREARHKAFEAKEAARIAAIKAKRQARRTARKAKRAARKAAIKAKRQSLRALHHEHARLHHQHRHRASKVPPVAPIVKVTAVANATRVHRRRRHGRRHGRGRRGGRRA